MTAGTGWQAVAAMSLNRVIGEGARIPWHLAEDFRIFKQRTMGGTLLMGRKTWEAIGRPLPGRTSVVITRRSDYTVPEGVRVVTRFAGPGSLPADLPGPLFVIGGGEIYRQALPWCSALWLTLVRRTVQGDVRFPEFEDRFALAGVAHAGPDFEIREYRPRFSGAPSQRVSAE